MLSDALSMSSLTSWQRAALLGELGKELIFERDIEGRRRALENSRCCCTGSPPVNGCSSSRRLGRPRTSVPVGRCCCVRPTRRAPCSTMNHRCRRPNVGGSADLAYTALHLGDREVLDWAIDAMSALDAETGAVRNSMTLLHETMRSMVDGDVSAAELLADDLVHRLEALGVPEAVAYRSTTTLAISRERGTMIDLAAAIDVLARAGHPQGPERATAAFVRFLRGDLDRVRVALGDLDVKDFADDETLQLCIAFWAEVDPGLRSGVHCRSFIDLLAGNSGVNLLIGGMYLGPVDRLLACSTMRWASTNGPMRCSTRQRNSRWNCPVRPGWRARRSIGQRRCWLVASEIALWSRSAQRQISRRPRPRRDPAAPRRPHRPTRPHS